MSLDRREALRLIVALSVAACSAPPPPLALPPRRHAAAARQIGQAWLKAAGVMTDAQALADALGAGAPAEPAAFTAWIRERHQADLAAGRTTQVDGWLLSLTEARLYGLYALLP
ncbi:MAG: hypothetical protein H6706_06245 [Myxococcales bacterium]|nr:hypothetical protein [Myxococcales bacterium]